MKKSFILTLLIGLFASCTGCKDNSVQDSVAADSVVVDSVITLETIPHMISTDRQQMFLQVQNDYRWYETCVEFDNFLDEENDGTVHGVVNIFQAIVEKGNGADVTVYSFTHLADTMAIYPKQGFWIEDFPLNEEVIKLSWKEAFDKIMATNAPKPHSKQAVLRKPIGPLDCNAQYVFGNIQSQLWVDAVTGDVKNSNPAFPEAFKMPLGEWP